MCEVLSLSPLTEPYIRKLRFMSMTLEGHDDVIKEHHYYNIFISHFGCSPMINLFHVAWRGNFEAWIEYFQDISHVIWNPRHIISRVIWNPDFG